jgi:hypothetical protein
MYSKIIFLPYLLVPLILSLLFLKVSTRLFFTYIISLLIFIVYPYFIVGINNYFSPPQEEAQCGMPQAALIFGSYFLFLPASLILQLIFNFLFHKKLA